MSQSDDINKLTDALKNCSINEGIIKPKVKECSQYCKHCLYPEEQLPYYRVYKYRMEVKILQLLNDVDKMFIYRIKYCLVPHHRLPKDRYFLAILYKMESKGLIAIDKCYASLPQ